MNDQSVIYDSSFTDETQTNSYLTTVSIGSDSN